MDDHRLRKRLTLERHRAGDKPIIELVPGPHPYLWIGDGSGCYATVPVKKATRSFLSKVLTYTGPEEEGNG